MVVEGFGGSEYVVVECCLGEGFGNLFVLGLFLFGGEVVVWLVLVEGVDLEEMIGG